jgi:hypothetical protein
VDLKAELQRALTRIGQARATAFTQVSTRYLTGADEVGSPAEHADSALVGRLRKRGYRLEGVGFAITGIDVVVDRGSNLDVRALVTTSPHRQVKATTDATVPVPQDGPRAVIFTLVAVDSPAAGAGRWRVRDVRAAT